MVKRKRGAESLSIRHLEKLQEDISRALKEAKGYERQRMSKRQREANVTEEKKVKLEREIFVLKVCCDAQTITNKYDVGRASLANQFPFSAQSLDLHQTARAHLYSSLLRIKSIASHEDLPEALKKGIAKPDLTEDERVALHNVTSGLYNRDGVKKAVDKAIAFVCDALELPVPEKGKKGKRERKGKTEEQDEDSNPPAAPVEATQAKAVVNDAGNNDEDETDFEGFSNDEDEGAEAEDIDGDAAVTQENDFAAMGGLLGSSDDEDENDEEQARLWDKYRGKETVNLDDISVSGGDSDPEDDQDDDDEADDESDEAAEPAAETQTPKKITRPVSLSPSPEPQRKKAKKSAVVGRPTDSTFLPSLMGGYVSGSESASDVDVAPVKKRRGQRARQAIWEKKYGRNAKHLQEAAKKNKGGRDAGWDMKRGAVDGSEDRRTPWKHGVKSPFSSNKGDSSGAGGAGSSQRQETRRPPPPTKRDDEGTLHPSWEARKKAKDAQKVTAFSGSKVVFD